MADLIRNGSMDISQNGRECVPGLTVGCGHATWAVSIATRPLGCSGREHEMGDYENDTG